MSPGERGCDETLVAQAFAEVLQIEFLDFDLLRFPGIQRIPHLPHIGSSHRGRSWPVKVLQTPPKLPLHRGAFLEKRSYILVFRSSNSANAHRFPGLSGLQGFYRLVSLCWDDLFGGFFIVFAIETSEIAVVPPSVAADGPVGPRGDVVALPTVARALAGEQGDGLAEVVFVNR